MMETTSLSKTTEIERISSLETCGLSTRTQDDTTLIYIVLIGKCSQWSMVHGQNLHLDSQHYRQSTHITTSSSSSQSNHMIPCSRNKYCSTGHRRIIHLEMLFVQRSQHRHRSVAKNTYSCVSIHTSALCMKALFLVSIYTLPHYA